MYFVIVNYKESLQDVSTKSCSCQNATLGDDLDPSVFRHLHRPFRVDGGPRRGRPEKRHSGLWTHASRSELFSESLRNSQESLRILSDSLSVLPIWLCNLSASIF